MVAIITILVELLFIYTQPNDPNEDMMEQSQIVKNTFMEFYRATMSQNSTGWK